MKKIHNIIVAAGSGSRFGGPLPKQFLNLGGRPVAMHAIARLRESLPGATDTIVLAASEIERWEDLCREHGFKSPEIAAGGPTRFHSVMNALACVPEDTDIIMVHDGARPFPSRAMIERLVAAFVAEDCDGAILAVAVTDSLREVAADGSSQSVDRARFRAVQTPQAFPAAVLKDAYSRAGDASLFTDDASVVEAAGYNRIRLVEGSAYNLKITNPRDLSVAESLIGQADS